LESSLNFLSFKIFHIFEGMSVFWIWLIGFYFLKCSPIKFFIIIWVLLIVLCKIDSFWRNRCSFSKLLNLKLKLKFYQMHFWFEFFDIIWMKKEQLSTIAMVLNVKTLLFFNFDYFFLSWHPLWLVLMWLHPKVQIPFSC